MPETSAPSASKTVTAALLIIGNEILSGRTRDANLQFLALELNKLGVRMVECRVVPDIEKTIVDTLNEMRRKFDYVFTTGGIGPTHDDITADCIAKAFGVGISEHPEAVARMTKHYGDPALFTPARRRMAHAVGDPMPDSQHEQAQHRMQETSESHKQNDRHTKVRDDRCHHRIGLRTTHFVVFENRDSRQCDLRVREPALVFESFVLRGAPRSLADNPHIGPCL